VLRRQRVTARARFRSWVVDREQPAGRVLLEPFPDVALVGAGSLWHFPRSGAIQVVQDADRAGGALLTLGVDDLEGELGGLRERGLDPGAMDDTTSDKVLFATVTDPEGNAITLVEQR
jgi:hypothetical protein